MNLSSEQQLKLVSVLGCLVESGKQFDHPQACDCQLCRDLSSAQELLDEVDPQ